MEIECLGCARNPRSTAPRDEARGRRHTIQQAPHRRGGNQCRRGAGRRRPHARRQRPCAAVGLRLDGRGRVRRRRHVACPGNGGRRATRPRDTAHGGRRVMAHRPDRLGHLQRRRTARFPQCRGRRLLGLRRSRHRRDAPVPLDLGDEPGGHGRREPAADRRRDRADVLLPVVRRHPVEPVRAVPPVRPRVSRGVRVRRDPDAPGDRRRVAAAQPLGGIAARVRRHRRAGDRVHPLDRPASHAELRHGIDDPRSAVGVRVDRDRDRRPARRPQPRSPGGGGGTEPPWRGPPGGHVPRS